MNLQAYPKIFWDFDGVIKDSVEIKTQAFATLFAPYGEKVVSQVVEHHQNHGGLSRMVKIPLYFETFLQKPLNQDVLATLLSQFEELCLEKVVAAPWVPGALEYLQMQHNRQEFYIVTGTPEPEILEITQRLGIQGFFRGIFGAPRKKAEIIASVLQATPNTRSLMIGDALQDYQAAQANHIDFLLRETPKGTELFTQITCPRVPHFCSFL